MRHCCLVLRHSWWIFVYLNSWYTFRHQYGVSSQFGSVDSYLSVNYHSVKSVGIRTEYGEIRSISPYSVRIRENTDQKNSEYGHILRSVCCLTQFITMFHFYTPIKGHENSCFLTFSGAVEMKYWTEIS